MGYPPIEHPYYYNPYLDPNDPLVNPPGIGFAGWFSRVTATFQRSARSTLLIIFLTQGLPILLFYLVFAALAAAGVAAGPERLSEILGVDLATEAADPAEVLPLMIGFLAVAIVGALVVSYLQGVGWAAATWAMTREAATGQPAPLGAALRYGVRRGLGLWGWSIVAALVIGLGLIACLLPGIYALFGLALLGPIYLYERGQRPFTGSFAALRRNPGLVLGRVAIVALVVIGVSFVFNMIEQILLTPLTDSTGAIVSLVFGAVSNLLLVPVYAFQAVALNLTYAEERAHQAPVSTQQLMHDLGD